MKKFTLSVSSLFGIVILSGCAQIAHQRTPDYVFNGTQGCRIHSGYFIAKNEGGCETYFDAWDRGGYAHAKALLMRDAQNHQSELTAEVGTVRLTESVRYSDRDLLPSGSRRSFESPSTTQSDTQSVREKGIVCSITGTLCE